MLLRLDEQFKSLWQERFFCGVGPFQVGSDRQDAFDSDRSPGCWSIPAGEASNRSNPETQQLDHMNPPPCALLKDSTDMLHNQIYQPVNKTFKNV